MGLYGTLAKLGAYALQIFIPNGSFADRILDAESLPAILAAGAEIGGTVADRFEGKTRTVLEAGSALINVGTTGYFASNAALHLYATAVGNGLHIIPATFAGVTAVLTGGSLVKSIRDIRDNREAIKRAGSRIVEGVRDLRDRYDNRRNNPRSHGDLYE